MQVSTPKPFFEDSRGEIIDILTQEPIDYVTLIRSVKGATRGNHYHNETVQYIYVMEGKIKLLSQMPGDPVVPVVLEPGNLAVNVPTERHSMVALEDTVFLVFTRGIRGGTDYEKDTYRLEEPLQE